MNIGSTIIRYHDGLCPDSGGICHIKQVQVGTLITLFNLDTQNSMDAILIWSRIIVVTGPPPLPNWIQN